MEEKYQCRKAWFGLAFLLSVSIVSGPFIYSSSSFGSSPQISFQAQTRVAERRLRIQRIVMGLDSIGDVTAQMMPENADRIEPLLEDLEDRAVGLSAQGEIDKVSVDSELTKIEGSVEKLHRAISKMVEPEVTL